jgi:hypothetical protein
MAITEEMIAALMEAQQKVDAAQRDLSIAQIEAATLVPASVWDENLNMWRDQQTAPAEQALELATAERNRCLEPTGLSVEQWLLKLANARAKVHVSA